MISTVSFKRALCCSRAGGVRAAQCTCDSVLVCNCVCPQGHSGLCKQAAGTGHADVQTQRHFPAAVQRLWDWRHHHRLGGRKPQQIRYAVALLSGSVTYTMHCCHTKHTFKKSTWSFCSAGDTGWSSSVSHSLWTCPWVTCPHRNTQRGTKPTDDYETLSLRPSFCMRSLQSSVLLCRWEAGLESAALHNQGLLYSLAGWPHQWPEPSPVSVSWPAQRRSLRQVLHPPTLYVSAHF